MFGRARTCVIVRSRRSRHATRKSDFPSSTRQSRGANLPQDGGDCRQQDGVKTLLKRNLWFNQTTRYERIGLPWAELYATKTRLFPGQHQIFIKGLMSVSCLCSYSDTAWIMKQNTGRMETEELETKEGAGRELECSSHCQRADVTEV